MSDIYQKANRVIIWLGEEDESSRLCRQWLDSIDGLLTPSIAAKATRESPRYRGPHRYVFIHDTLNDPEFAPELVIAIGKQLARSWFRRGWIVQEFLLARNIICLTGDIHFTVSDPDDLRAVPLFRYKSAATYASRNHDILMRLRTKLAEHSKPLRFLQLMARVAGRFETNQLTDLLYGLLGLIK